MRIVYAYNERLPLRKAHDVYVVRTCHALASAGHQVQLLVARSRLQGDDLLAHYGLGATEGLVIRGLPSLRRTRGRPGASWGAIFHLAARWTIRQLAERNGVDVLLTSTLKLAAALHPGGRARGPLHVYDLHELLGREADGPLRRLEQRVLSEVDGVVVTTRALADLIRELYHPPGPVETIPLACPPAPMAAPPPPYRPGAEPFRLGYTGQLHRLQGLEVALEALGRLDGVELHLVGGSPGDQARLRRVAEGFGVAGRVRFHGFVPPRELPGAVEPFHALLLPSLAQGGRPYETPMKLFEYFTFRRPIIASDLPSVRELLTHAETGWLVPPGDPAALADAVETLRRDRALVRELADGAYAEVARFSPRARAERLTSFLKAVRAQRAQAPWP